LAGACSAFIFAGNSGQVHTGALTGFEAARQYKPVRAMPSIT
jgi:hypothetical protein